jgi:O-antigen ligase
MKSMNVTPMPPRPWADRTRLGIVLALISACFLWGGGSRLDIAGLVILQPFAILCAVALALLPGPARWGSVKVPLLLLVGLATIIAVQLIPLPSAIWTRLPGQEQFRLFVAVTGDDRSWRPVTLTPDLTLSALAGLSVPAVALMGFASLSEEQTHKLLNFLLVAAIVSALFGLAQILGGAHNGFYRYAITNEGSGVGLFANRNHQAVLLAMAWPMLALWATAGRRGPEQRVLRQWIAGSVAIFLVPMMVVTGSRAGLVLGVVGLAFAWAILRAGRDHSGHATPKRNALLWKIVPVLGGLGALVASVMVSRAEAIQRLSSTVFSDELRIAYVPTLLRISSDFFPFGSGFGSFDPVFRHYEPNDLLSDTYLNHAHNDLLELLITGGLPAAVLAACFLFWAARRFFLMFRNMRRMSTSRGFRFALLAVAMITISLLSSLVDYPLRTPVHGMIFVFACGWLAAFQPGRGAEISEHDHA